MIDLLLRTFFKILGRRKRNDRLVEKRVSYFEGSKKLFVLIAPYSTGLEVFSRVEKFINARGQSFIAYKFPSAILNSDHDAVYRGFKKIQSDITRDLRDLEKEYGLEAIEMLGFSLSCVPTMMIANGNPLVREIRLVVPGHSLAESLWCGIRTDDLRHAFEKKGVTLEALEKYWSDLAPEHNIDKLEGKKLSITLSEADTVIPYRFGMRLVEALKKRNVPFTLTTNKRLGHYLTVAHLLLAPKKFIGRD